MERGKGSGVMQYIKLFQLVVLSLANDIHHYQNYVTGRNNLMYCMIPDPFPLHSDQWVKGLAAPPGYVVCTYVYGMYLLM